MASKTAFENAQRDSVYTFDPMLLRIVGGTLIPTEDERSDADTEPNDKDPAQDLIALKQPLALGFRSNILAMGVRQTIEIVKIGDMPVVLEGRSRVRAARAANRVRAARGEPLIKVKCVISRSPSALQMVMVKIGGNEARRTTSFLEKLSNLQDLLNAGGSEEDAAIAFAVDPQTIRAWLKFDDHATDLTKQAVRDGRLSAYAAAEVAKIKNPEEQNQKLMGLLAAPDKSVRAARAARGDKASASPLIGKRGRTAFLDYVQQMQHRAGADKTIAFFEGVESLLKAMAGQEGVDERLTKALDKFKTAQAAQAEQAEA